MDLGQPVAEQELGIDVDVADTGAEVERVAGGAQPLALAHGVAPPDVDRAEEGGRGAHPVGVEDDDVELASDRPGEGDDPVGGRSHRLTVGGVVLDAAVAGHPALGGRPERVDDGGVDRRPVGDAVGRRAVGRRGRGQSEHERYGHQHGEPRHGFPPGVRDTLGGSGGVSKTTGWRRIARG